MHQLSERTLDMLIDKRIQELTPRSDSEDGATNARYRIDGNFRVDNAERKDALDPNDPDPELAQAEMRRDLAAGKIANAEAKPARKAAPRIDADDPDPEGAKSEMLRRDAGGSDADE